VVRGPLPGMERIVLRRESRNRVVFFSEPIQRSMAMEIRRSGFRRDLKSLSKNQN